MKAQYLMVLALAGCKGAPPDRTGGSEGKTGAVAAGPAAALESRDEASSSDRTATSPVAGPPVTGGAASTGTAFARRALDSTNAGMIIRTGDASLEVDSLEPAVAAVQALARRVDGWIANTTMSGGREQVREATLQLRIPAARFGEVEAALPAIGKVEWVNVAAQDVGEEYADLSARAANARRLEERLIELLARRTGKLEDVLAVERELARVREEIERYEARLRFLSAHVSTSTLSVRVHEPLPIIAGTGSSGVIAESFRQAWRNFVAALAGAIAASGVIVPLGIVGVGAWLAARKLARGR